MELGLSQAILAWGPDTTILLFFTVTCAADHSNLRLLDPVRAGTDLKPATVLLPRLLCLVTRKTACRPVAATPAGRRQRGRTRKEFFSRDSFLCEPNFEDGPIICPEADQNRKFDLPRKREVTQRMKHVKKNLCTGKFIVSRFSYG